jgi:AcrR family transcriptional regulator
MLPRPGSARVKSQPHELLLPDAAARRFTQERARKTYEALVEAAEEAFHEKGFDATQTPDIAARAGVSVGTFYRYFTDKKEIYLEVVRRTLYTAHHEVLDRLTPERFANKERRATVAEAIRILLDLSTSSPQMSRVFREMSMRDPDVAELKRVFDEEGLRRLTSLIGAVCPIDQVPDPSATAVILHTAVIETANLIAGVSGECAVPRERIERALSEMILRTLFGTER